MKTTETAITLEDVGKRFRRHLDQRTSIKERIFRGRPRQIEDFWAVRHISLDIPRGSTFGLIGHNGSGKSTLLKMLANIYRPTEGSIRTQGRVAALIEVGAGFHPEMTGRENIELNGAILGLSRKEISAATEEIIDFSGLRQFINDPVKHYSSGMYVRLGFSVAVHMKPDILLVDEVLAVGDEEFQRRCLDHIAGLRKAGVTIVIVSHGLGQIEAMCDEATWLDHGRAQLTGQPAKVTTEYLKQVNADEALRNPNLAATRAEEDPSQGLSALRLKSAELRGSGGEAVNHAKTDSPFEIHVVLDALEPVLGPNVRIALQHETGPLVTMLSNHREDIDLGTVTGRNRVTMTMPNNQLLPGRYAVHIDVFDHTGARLLDSWNDAFEFAVRSGRGEVNQGFIHIPTRFAIERLDERA